MELLDESIVPEEVREVKREAREFSEEYIMPNAEEYYASGEYPWEILEAGQEAGLVAQDIGEEYGGKGYGLHEMLAIAEEFYRADAGIALTLQLASFGAEIVEEYGNEEQKEEYIAPVAACDQITGSRGLGTTDRIGSGGDDDVGREGRRRVGSQWREVLGRQRRGSRLAHRLRQE